MKKVLAVLLVILFGVTVSLAAEKQDFWGKLKSKVEKITPSKGGQSTTAVGGVRGAKDETGDTLYWKGKEPQVSKDELESFNKALDSATKGQKADAIRKFEAFLKQYPSSALAGDAKESLKKLKTE